MLEMLVYANKYFNFFEGCQQQWKMINPQKVTYISPNLWAWERAFGKVSTLSQYESLKVWLFDGSCFVQQFPSSSLCQQQLLIDYCIPSFIQWVDSDFSADGCCWPVNRYKQWEVNTDISKVTSLTVSKQHPTSMKCLIRQGWITTSQTPFHKKLIYGWDLGIDLKGMQSNGLCQMKQMIGKAWRASLQCSLHLIQCLNRTMDWVLGRPFIYITDD